MRISKQWRYVVSKQKTMVSGLLVMCLLLPSHEREGEQVKGQREEERRVEPPCSLGNRHVCECARIQEVI